MLILYHKLLKKGDDCLVNKRNSGRKRTTRTDDGLRADRRERNQEFKDKQNELDELQDNPPRHLDGYGVTIWRKLVPDLKKLGTIKQIDTVNLEAFCSLYSTYRTAETDVQKNGIFVSYEVDKTELDEETGLELVVGKETKYDRSKKNPAYGIMNDSIKTLKSLAVDLGLSFDSRSGQLVPSDLTILDGDKEDSLRLVKFGAEI